MLQEFWNYFTTTGDIDMYLNYKAYEEISLSPNGGDPKDLSGE